MERMVNQNTYDDISQDFKYYEDAGDDYKEGRGTLLPLWRFRYDKARKMAVTALAWSPLYSDLFAVGHGSYDFNNQSGGGIICLHSLKNPSFPEFIFSTGCGVMCLDIHPEHPHLLAAGLYDGTVAVYNLILTERDQPVFRSTVDTGKHTDPVWQVCWQKNDMEGNINFYSVSADGRVVIWRLIKNELQWEDVVQVSLPGEMTEGVEGTRNNVISSGTCIGFNPFLEHLFLVGSESGHVYTCSKAYTKHFLNVTKNHHMAVHALRWNPFHQNVFASCGADWTVRIWDHTLSDPMFSYDLNSVVGDVAWSPFSSTVFAAVTADGKVHVFDLSVNKYESLCVQSVIQKKKTRLTHVAFNPVHPLLCVGDDRGTVLCLKLSPNLRKALREKNKTNESEKAKMEKLIQFVREPLLELQTSSGGKHPPPTPPAITT
ncbi:Dynein intermediate chain 1, axonemal [Geodia barretti]|nr:Dynein intermediate chain 1, axonemal [Geodia barretti]